LEEASCTSEEVEKKAGLASVLTKRMADRGQARLTPPAIARHGATD